MAGRPPLPVGAHGNITAKAIGKRTWRARCYVRDADGHRREVVRTATSRDSARWAVQDALKDRPAFSGSDITRESLIDEVAAAWFAMLDREVEEGSKSPGTVRTYYSAWTTHIQPGIGALRCRECSVSRLEDFLVELGNRQMTSARRKSVKTVMSGITGYATRMGAIPTNPVRDTSRIVATAKKAARALTDEEITTWLAYLFERQRAAALTARPDVHDLYDLTCMMLATGVRISEMLAVLIEDVDLGAGTIVVGHRIYRVKGKGLQRAPRRGNKGAAATLKLPSWAVTLVEGRRTVLGPSGPLFPSTSGTWRDLSNVSHAYRKARAAVGLDWMTSHSFRKTVATKLDVAGVAVRVISDQLQHSKIEMTQDRYIQRGVIGDEVADVLEALDPAKRRRINGE
jgi:integrase